LLPELGLLLKVPSWLKLLRFLVPEGDCQFNV
jgi:hypothetical protein